jgi:hypothetical protein
MTILQNPAPAFGVPRLAAAFILILALSSADAADSATNAVSTPITNTPIASTNREGERPREPLPQSQTQPPPQSELQPQSQPTTAAADAKDTADFNEFKIILDRNIFDPNRAAPGARRRTEDKPKPTRIDYLNLVGAMSYEKGRFAFFDGTSSEYRKSVKPGDSIAGYKVADVTQNTVTLQSGDKKLDLPVGGQLKRIDEGEWQLNSAPESFASSSSNSASSTGSLTNNLKSGGGNSTDEENPILKRLLEQRRQGK